MDITLEWLEHPILGPLVEKYGKEAVKVIYFMKYPYKNPYFNVVGDLSRWNEIMNSMQTDMDYDDFSKAFDFVDRYFANRNPDYTRLVSAIKIADTAIEALEKVDYTERTMRGALVWKPSDVVNGLTKLNALLSTLNTLLSKYGENEEAIILGTGGRSISIFEKPMNIERRQLQ